MHQINFAAALCASQTPLDDGADDEVETDKLLKRDHNEIVEEAARAQRKGSGKKEGAFDFASLRPRSLATQPEACRAQSEAACLSEDARFSVYKSERKLAAAPRIQRIARMANSPTFFLNESDQKN